MRAGAGRSAAARAPLALGLGACILAVGACAAPAVTPAAPPGGGASEETPPSGPPASEPTPVTAGLAAPAGTYDQPVDVVHYDIEVGVSDTAAWIQGRTRIRVAVLAPLDEAFALDFTGLAVDDVRVDGRPVRAEHRDGRLLVPLDGAGPGDTATVQVLYRGTPDDGLIVGRNVHGQPSVFADNWPNRARFWFPSVDHPSDKATVAFTVHAPGGWQVIANGALQGEPRPAATEAMGPGATDPRRTWRWATEVPIPTYTMVIGAAELVIDEVGSAACAPGAAPRGAAPDGCVSVTTWLFPRDAERAAASFRRAALMVDHFTGLVGPFPYEKLANVQSATRFGGMENASAIFYSEEALARGADIEGTVSHEIAHQWFGDSVTEADWHHLWLSEGFATYFGAQFFQAADGEAAFRTLMEGRRQSYLASDVVDRPVIDPEEGNLFELLNANNYPKGGWVLHMLRGIMGDEAFFRGVREYYRRHADGTALTEDFRWAMEAAGGEDLGWFFHQWLREPGYPVLRVDSRWDAAEGEAVVTVRQEQSSSWPTFRLPTVLELHTPSGAVRRNVTLREREQVFRVGAPAPPTRVLVDPDGWILKRMNDEPVPTGGTP